MKHHLSQTLHKWLRALHFPISKHHLQEQLETHPHYPSLLAITDTLDNLGIPNGAFVVDKSNWNELPFPFLAFTGILKDDLIIVQRDMQPALHNNGKLSNWNGIALFAEKPADWANHENSLKLSAEKLQRQRWMLTLGGLLLLSILHLSLSSAHQFTFLSLFIAGLAGLGIACLLFGRELGIESSFTEKLCSGKHADCDVVIRSKGSKLSQSINWTDLGIIYFTALSGLLLLNANTVPVITLLPVPFTFFSLYYQWKVVKQWCTLCLLTVAILWLQYAIVLLSYGPLQPITHIQPADLVLPSLLFAGTGTGWLLLLKPLLRSSLVQQDKLNRLKRFKYNTQLFAHHLSQQRHADITPLADDIQLGNPAAPVQVMVACGPYCGPCAKTHKQLHQWVERQDIGLTVRFMMNREHTGDKRFIIAAYLLGLMKGKPAAYKRQVLHDWYEMMDEPAFKKKYPIPGDTDETASLLAHIDWGEKFDIQYTPAIFINGAEKPLGYNLEEIERICHYFGNNSEQVEPLAVLTQA